MMSSSHEDSRNATITTETEKNSLKSKKANSENAEKHCLLSLCKMKIQLCDQVEPRARIVSVVKSSSSPKKN